MNDSFELIKAFYQEKKVFITGCSGFKGTWMVILLKMLGSNISGLSLPNDYSPLFEKISDSYLNWYKEDVNDIVGLQKAIVDSKPDIILHFAANGFISKCQSNPVEAFSTNVMGVVNLFESVKKLDYPLSIVIVTTDKVYVNTNDNLSFKEEDAIGSTLDIYSTTKSCAELVIKGYRQAYFNINEYDKHKKAIAVARASNVLGPGDYVESRIVPTILNAIDKNTDIILRNPDAIRPYQNVFDVLYGYLLLARQLYIYNVQYSGEWNFGPEDEGVLRTKQLVDVFLNRSSTKSNIQTQKNTEYCEATVLKLDSLKAKKLLGWSIKKNIIQTVDDIIEYHNSTDKLNTANSLAVDYLNSI